MRRRELLLGVAAAATASPLAAGAQPVERMRRIGVLYSGNDPAQDALLTQEIDAFAEALTRLNWTPGDKIELIQPSAEGLGARARELVQRDADVVLTIGAPALVAVLAQTHTVPIVFTHLGDPISAGLISSLAHPGENVTGFAVHEPALAGKWLETLKQVAPHVSRAMILAQADSPPQRVMRDAVVAVAPSLRVTVTVAQVRSLADCEREVAEFARAPDGGLVVFPNAISMGNSSAIQALARRYRLPAVYSYPVFARTGGLVSYGADPVKQFPEAARYVDRILRGARAGDLPVQLPTKFELVINLKTAKELDLIIPQLLLAQADEVVE